MSPKLKRQQATAVLVALLILFAGCSGLGGSDASTPTDESTTDDGATQDADGNATGTGNESSMSGRLLFVINGQDKHLETGQNSSFRINDSDRHTWHAEESMTLAAALKQAGVNATADSLTYNGTTYRESDENTTVTYRVGGTPVDPTEYKLEDLNPAHEVVVRVDSGNQETPGRQLDQSHPHPHGKLDVVVKGQELNLTKEKYVHADDHFHFHGDENASRWHGHSVNVTAAYAISSFPGMNLTADTFTYNGTTYGANESTTVEVTVNGEPVNQTEYVLKDGDELRVSVNETG